ncbi:ribonuclease H-like domain-containing protein [Methanobrevibacter sp. DSM 116169]|uniref:ribonuclease H-like domain-containing protein n=1 Tax=Methanobrevibacter sp. DSM 116169 TaxID=3242727 RepID=UPI0038FCE73F
MKNNKLNEFLESQLSNSLGSSTYVGDGSYAYFKQLKESLIEKHQDQSLEDIKGLSKIDTDYGETLKIISKEKIDFNLENCNFKDNLNHNLKLIPRIGPNKEISLKEKGFNTIEDLTSHEKYSKSAKEVLDTLENKSFLDIYNLLQCNKYSKECKDNIIKSTSIVDSEKFKFMDIETLGLSNCPIILIGVAEIEGNTITTSQYFLENKTQEKAVIDSYLAHINDDSIHVTFNGASFDIPFIKNRSNYYNISKDLNQCHFDLIYFARNLWKNQLPNCRLTTIEEEIFDIKRIDDVPGSEIPDYYDTYLKTNNIGPIIPIIEHNRQDIVSLASFLMKMYSETLNNY